MQPRNLTEVLIKKQFSNTNFYVFLRFSILDIYIEIVQNVWKKNAT